MDQTYGIHFQIHRLTLLPSCWGAGRRRLVVRIVDWLRYGYDDGGQLSNQPADMMAVVVTLWRVEFHVDS